MSDDFVVTVVQTGHAPQDLKLRLATEPTDDDVFQAISPFVGADVSEFTLARAGTKIRPGSHSRSELLHGDVLRAAGSAGAGPFRLVGTGDSSAVVFGFDGDRVVGRSVSGADGIRLADKTVSGRHARFEVRDGSVTVTDLGSTNGTYVNGTVVKKTVVLVSGDEVDFGEQAIFRFESDLWSGPRESTPQAERLGGRLAVNRPPRNIVKSPAGVTRISGAPPAARRRKFPVGATAIPVVGGTLAFLFFRNPMFLIFTAMGPSMAIWNFFESRREDWRSHEEQVAAFDQQLLSAGAELVDAGVQEDAWFESVLPAWAGVETRVVSGVGLWDRSPEHEDFGWIRVGSARQSGLRRVEVERRGDPELVERAVALEEQQHLSRLSPVKVAVVSEPVAGFVGRGERVEGPVAHGLFELAARHAPADLAICVVSTNPDWGWVRWLPHASSMAGVVGSAVATDPETCLSVFEAVERLVERRLAGQDLAVGSGGLMSPHVVVLIVPPVPIPPTELNGFVERCGQAGVSVLWVAGSAANLPTACQVIADFEGEAQLRRPSSGEVVALESVERLSHRDADRLARRLAPFVERGGRVGVGAVPDLVSDCRCEWVDGDRNPVRHHQPVGSRSEKSTGRDWAYRG